ncbi:MAG: ArgR family transcriptional regulator [Spirochaetes bacterium]|nr:ArgR family transcriptional regulator [Spirochaetota bacterium]MBU0953988.1 ArgR family transcriptional regulator [Spirochaetota bacterium]
MRDLEGTNRPERLKLITRILRESKVESQDELLAVLSRHKVLITQATLSRDLKLLKVSKVGAGKSGYFYALPSEDELKHREEIYAHDFLRGYVSIEWNESLVVIKTYSGHSSSVALALDNLGFSGILGTLAGQDNNVFAALRSGYTGQQFMEDLKKRIPDFDEK